jgi:hypothetical protein
MCFSNNDNNTPPLLAIEGSRKRKQEQLLHEISSDENEQEQQQQQQQQHEESSKRRLLAPTNIHQQHVKFGTIIQTTEYPSTILHEDLDKQALWWRRQERVAIQQDCRETYTNFRKHQMESVHRYLQVFRQCQMADSDNESSEELDDITLIVPDRIRGLEWGLNPSSTKDLRSVHMENVLHVQANLVLHASKESMKARVLGLNSIRSSRPSRVLARLLGEGDAAKLQHKKTSKPKSKSLLPPPQHHHYSKTTTTKPPSSRPRMWCQMSNP